MPLEQVLQDPTVKAAAGLIVIPVALLLLLAAVVALLRVILRESPEVESAHPRKYSRFEAGNPEKGAARARVSMQYLGFLIIFLAVEPAVVLLALTAAAPRSLAERLGVFYAVIVAVYAPLLAYALREARDVRKWMLNAG